jgi:hypothetical protein
VPEYDPLYVAARSVLLDALDALGPQRDAVVVVGAQAVYMQLGADSGGTSTYLPNADPGVAPYTTDADLALAPANLADAPLLEQLMRQADFWLRERQPGSWVKTVTVEGQSVDVPVDLMVPEGVAPSGGRRSVQLGPHSKMVARRALGLEGALIDNDSLDVTALDNRDDRRFTVRIAGPAALVVAKLHKLHDRLQLGQADRIADKDAADIYRIMQAVPVGDFLERLRPLSTDLQAKAPTRAALGFLDQLFGARANQGVRMAINALRVAVPAERVETICVSFARQVRSGIESW